MAKFLLDEVTLVNKNKPVELLVFALRIIEFAAKEKLGIVNVRRSRSEFIHPHEASRALRGEQTPFELF